MSKDYCRYSEALFLWLNLAHIIPYSYIFCVLKMKRSEIKLSSKKNRRQQTASSVMTTFSIFEILLFLYALQFI